MPTLEYDQECKRCKGTGLYVGVAEQDGAAVVCYTCNGTGCEHIKTTYNEFKGRVGPPVKVKRVYQVNPGIVVGGEHLEDFGGIPVKDWMNGAEFTLGTEDREHTCPAWFYQCVSYAKRPDWYECGVGVYFPNCPHFSNKAACWARWDEEQK